MTPSFLSGKGLQPVGHMPCGCRFDLVTQTKTRLCPEHRTFEINITTANALIAEWGLIAASIARQCKWRPLGQCLVTCQGLAICDLDGLILVDANGRPAALPELQP